MSFITEVDYVSLEQVTSEVKILGANDSLLLVRCEVRKVTSYFVFFFGVTMDSFSNEFLF